MSDHPRQPPASERPTATDEGTDLHPAPTELVAYHRRRLHPHAGERIRDHLSRCAACADLVLDLARHGVLPAPPAGGATSGEERSRVMERLAARLREALERKEGW